MSTPLPAAALAQLFHDARTHSHWQQREVSDETLQQLFELLKLCPTSANASPARFVFLKSSAAKEQLRPFLMEGNVDKTLSAPVCVIVAQDMQFYEHLPRLYPHADAKSWFEGNAAAIEATAARNSTLQGAYLIMAARALGLDCGPMSGFDNAGVDAAFFPDGQWRSLLVVNLGYGVTEGLPPRGPRLAFEQAAAIV